jgi:glycosyltransferase involved in cell wall biosynthesis
VTPELSIVVPVYREERNLPEFLRRVRPVLDGLVADYEILFVMDPGPDRTEEVILEARAADPRVKLLKLSRRFGQPAATLAGLRYAAGRAVVVMDVDLQDPPELVREMVARWRAGDDVVLARRRSRKGETWVKKLVAGLGYRLINRLADVPIPPDTGDFRLLSRRAVDEVNRLKESHGFLRGLVALVGFRQSEVLFDRAARHAGAGNYNRFVGSLKIGLNGVVCFSSAPLRLATVLGLAAVTVALLAGPVVLLAWVVGLWPAAVGLGPALVGLLVLFLGGVQLVTTGILGEYVGRIYDEVKMRPTFVIDRAEGVEGVRP